MLLPLLRRRRDHPSLRLRRGVRTAALNDDGLAVIEARGSVLHLNATAQVILSALLAGHGIATTAAQFAEQFGVSEHAAHADVLAVVSELTSRNVVRWR